jgi:hypothetical protein
MKHNQTLNDLALFVGLFVMVIVIGGIVVAVVYGLLGYFDDAGRRWLATALIFAVAGAFVLGLQVGKAHVKGVERGLDLKLGAKERAQQAARSVSGAMVTTPPAAARFDDLLPQVGAAIVQRRDDDTTPIEM